MVENEKTDIQICKPYKLQIREMIVSFLDNESQTGLEIFIIYGPSE